MRKDRRIGCVIPALNEERAIPKVVADLPRWVDRVVVVDNGSSDGTAKAAREAGATVVREPERGYGAACLAGIARMDGMDVIVFLDGDYSDYPDELAALVEPVLSGKSDLVISSRTRGAPARGALTLQQRLGNWLACKLMNGLWRTCYTDLGPFRAIDASALALLAMRDRGYGWTVEMQIKAALAGLAVEEVPVRYRARIGTSKISGTVKGTLAAGAKIIVLIARFALTHGISPFPKRARTPAR